MEITGSGAGMLWSVPWLGPCFVAFLNEPLPAKSLVAVGVEGKAGETSNIALGS